MAEVRNLTALVVDDNEDIRNLLVTMLSSVLNLKIETATNGKDAYSKIMRNKPDILYTDVIMGDINGDRLLEMLVQDNYKIPTFVMSGTPNEPGFTRAVFYSHRMYTEEQIRALNLQVMPSIQGQQGYIDSVMNATPPDVHYDFGFNVFCKPVFNDILSKTKKVQEMLSRPTGI